MLLCDDEAEAEAKSFTHKHRRIERGEGRRDKLPHVQVGFRVSDQVYRLCILTDSAVLYGRTAHEMRSPSVASELAPRVFTYFTI